MQTSCSFLCAGYLGERKKEKSEEKEVLIGTWGKRHASFCILCKQLMVWLLWQRPPLLITEHGGCDAPGLGEVGKVGKGGLVILCT